MSWFDANPSGRILSRFAADLFAMDTSVGQTFDGSLQMLGGAMLLLVVICFTEWRFLPLVLVVTPLYFKTLLVIFRSLREGKRIANNAISPMVTNIAEAVRTRLVTRILGVESFLLRRQIEYTQNFLVANHVSTSLSQANALATTALSLIISSCVAFYALLSPDMNSSLAAICITCKSC